MNIREKIARAIVKARSGNDPDARVSPYALARTSTGGYFIPSEQAICPLWTLYVTEADAALKAIQQELRDNGIHLDWYEDQISRTLDNPA